MRLFAFDIDGTLFPYGQQKLPKEEVDALQSLLDQGDAICLASGRPFETLLELLKPLHGNHRYLVCANGAVAYDSDGNCITHASLSSKDFIHLQKYKRHPGMGVYAYEGLGGILATSHDYWVKEEQRINGLSDDHVTIIDLDKPIVGHDELYKIMIAGPKEIMEGFELDEEDESAYEHSRSAPTCLEILPKGANKGNRVDAIRRCLGIKKENVYCFGDEGNDMAMISMFNGVAMGNAIPELKKVAKYITLKADDHGVSYALKHILKVI